MPILKSAKKALRQSQKRHKRNLQKKKVMKDVVKKIHKFVSEGKNDEALGFMPQAYKAWDKAAKTGVVKKKTASRKKSRLTKLISKSAG